MLKVSLIIPVYNEEHHIRGCLDSIATQNVLPDEVIIVDNNCSDKTIEIAKKYEFVTIVTEKNQGRAHARSAGFNAAKNQILGRIDADTRLNNDWVEKLVNYFSNDSELCGITGLGKTSLLPILKWPKTTLFLRSYYWNVHGIFGTITTWGGNMAITKSAWLEVKDVVCLDDSMVHEDQDVALWIVSNSHKIIQANDLLTYSDNQSFRYIPKFIHYSKLRNKTKKLHKELGNLPAPLKFRIPMVERIGSHLLSVPVAIAGFLVSLIIFPLDFIMLKVVKNKKWFN